MRSKQSSAERNYNYFIADTPLRKISDSTAETLNEDDLYDINFNLPTRVRSTSSYRTPKSNLQNKSSGDNFQSSSKQSHNFISPQIKSEIHQNKKIDMLRLDNNLEINQNSQRIRRLKSLVQQKQSRNSQINCTNNNYYDKSGKKDNEIFEQSPDSEKNKIFNNSNIRNVKLNYNNQKIINKSQQLRDDLLNFKQAIENLNYYSENNTPISNASYKDNSLKNFNQSVSFENKKNQNFKVNQLDQRKKSNTTRSQNCKEMQDEIRQKSFTEAINKPQSVSTNSTQRNEITISKQKEIKQTKYQNYFNQQIRRGRRKESFDEFNTDKIQQKQIIKQCLDQYDHYRLETLNNDEQLDKNFIEEFMQLNHSFVEQNAQLHLHSIENMHANNYKASLESILKLNIPEKNIHLLESHVAKWNESRNKINQKLKFRNRSFTQQPVQKKEIFSHEYIRSPYDLVIIIDFNEQYRQNIISALREIILKQSTLRDRISLIFPSKYGKCVRTDLLICSSSNQQLLINEFEQTVSDVSNCFEFNEISFRNAIWILQERQFLNFQCALFWISEGEKLQFSGQSQSIEKIQSKSQKSGRQQQPLFEMVQEVLQQESVRIQEFNYSQNIYKQLEKQQLNAENAIKKLQIYTFQIGSKKTDSSLQQIVNLRQGLYYYINQIEDLQIKINQAIQHIISNVGFDFSATINLITHSQIKIKKSIETQSTLSQIPQIIIEDQNEYINHSDTYLNLNYTKSSFPTQSEINNLQQQNYRLYESEISKMYGGSNLWSRIDDSQISVRLPFVRHNSERNFGFQIVIKPSHKFSQCDIAEFEIANAVCIINTFPSYLCSNKDSDGIKKFSSCSTELHFLQNKVSSFNLPSVKNSTFNDFNNIISCDLSYLPKNKDKKNEIYQTIFNQEFISLFEDIYSNIKIDEDNYLRYAAKQLKNYVDNKSGQFKHTVKSSEFPIYGEIQEFQKFIDIFGFDERAKCYLKYLIQFYRNQ